MYSVKEHIDKREPWDIVTQQELAELWVRADILIDGKKKEEAKDLPPGTTVPSSEDTESTEATLQSPSKMSDEKKSVIREALTAEFSSLYEQNEKQVQRRAGYEELIRRPYFHTKPLGKSIRLQLYHYIHSNNSKSSAQYLRHKITILTLLCFYS